MKRYNTIIEGAKEPENKNDLWIKDGKPRLFLNGIWKSGVNSGYYSHLKDFDISGWNGIN